MSGIKPLSDKDLQFKPYISSTKKIAGRVVESELETPVFNEDSMGELLAGVETSEIEEGRSQLMAENPALASQNMNDFLDKATGALEDEQAQKVLSNTNIARQKRVGSIMDRETGDSMKFRRIHGGSQVELQDDQGQVLDTVSSLEFEQLVSEGEYVVL